MKAFQSKGTAYKKKMAIQSHRKHYLINKTCATYGLKIHCKGKAVGLKLGDNCKRF